MFKMMNKRKNRGKQKGKSRHREPSTRLSDLSENFSVYSEDQSVYSDGTSVYSDDQSIYSDDYSDTTSMYSDRSSAYTDFRSTGYSSRSSAYSDRSSAYSSARPRAIPSITPKRPTLTQNTYPHGKASKSEWSYYVVGLFFIIAIAGIFMYPLPIYRTNIRYELYRVFGAKLQGTRWVGGNREMANFSFIVGTIGITTLLGGIAFALSPATSGNVSSFRSLHRKPFASLVNLSYGEMSYLFFLIALNGFWALVYITRFLGDLDKSGVTDTNTKFERIGFACGLLSVLNFVFLLLPATRQCFWLISVGIDYAHGIKYHRWIGYLMFLMLLAHCIPYYYSWYSQGTLMQNAWPCSNCDIGTAGRTSYQNLYGQIAFIAILVMVFTSLPYFRRNHYEFFYYSHHLYIIAIVFGCMHYSNLVLWLYPSICLYVIHRVLARAQCQYPTEIVEFEPLPAGVIRLVFRRSLCPSGHYEAGQFIYLRVPSISSMEWHAFSISSFPQDPQDTVSVHIKTLGIWTTKLYGKAVQYHQEGGTLPLIYVDGYYGKTQREFDHYPQVILIAGGIGGTPIVSILGHLFHQLRDNKDATCCEKVTLYWTSRELSIFQDFTSLFQQIKRFDPQQKLFEIHLIHTGKTSNGREKIEFPLTIQKRSTPDTSKVVKFPFKQSGRRPWHRILIFIVTFACSGIAVAYIRYGYRVLGENRLRQERWPLQRLLEVVAVVVGAAVSYVVALMERRSPALATFDKIDAENPKVRQKALKSSKFPYKFESERLDMKKMLSEKAGECAGNPEIQSKGVGIWVSGPLGLIKSAQVEASRTKDAIFDVHYEEFEL